MVVYIIFSRILGHKLYKKYNTFTYCTFKLVQRRVRGVLISVLITAAGLQILDPGEDALQCHSDPFGYHSKAGTILRASCFVK